MFNKNKIILIIFVFLFSGYASLADTSGTFSVVKVVDGDTIDVQQSEYGTVTRLRFILIDCPETKTVRKAGRIVRAEPYGQAAKQFVTKSIEKAGNKVFIKSDGNDTEQSVGHRTVVLVYLGDKDGECLNELLVKKGLATVRPEYGYKSQESDDRNKNSKSRKASFTLTKKLLELEREAKQQKVGIWSGEYAR